MLFHTWTFGLFFFVVYFGYLLLRRTSYWLHWLLFVSYVFYGWWNPLYLLLILYSTAVDYFAVLRMVASRRPKLWLVGSLANNLALLGFFKYAGFLTEQVNALLALFESLYRVPAPDILLPVGISFFTFQSMGYVIDCYLGVATPERNPIRFAAFVSLFPQLVAGPIERAGNLLVQLRTLPGLRAQDFADGLSLFTVGLFKKLAIANYLALYVDPIYAAPQRYSGAALAMATFAFAWEIYCDFSGYTDMARGVARILGFKLILNFDHPYLATGLGDFWSRWHISLSTWFRDYLYIPLGGSRFGALVTARNLFLTMLISGLWHGASWTFVTWGVLHGAAYVLIRPIERSQWYRRYVPTIIKQLAVFCFVCLTWVFFRAANMSDAWLVLHKILTGPWGDPRFPVLALALVTGLWGYEEVCESPARKLLAWPTFRVASVVCMLLYLCIAPGSGDVPFIYFQF